MSAHLALLQQSNIKNKCHFDISLACLSSPLKSNNGLEVKLNSRCKSQRFVKRHPTHIPLLCNTNMIEWPWWASGLIHQAQIKVTWSKHIGLRFKSLLGHATIIWCLKDLLSLLMLLDCDMTNFHSKS